MRWILASIALLSASGELAAQGKGIRLWNLTTATISSFQLSPAGKEAWGANQTLNDKDKEVDHDERLRITGVRRGRPPCPCRSGFGSVPKCSSRLAIAENQKSSTWSGSRAGCPCPMRQAHRRSLTAARPKPGSIALGNPSIVKLSAVTTLSDGHDFLPSRN